MASTACRSNTNTCASEPTTPAAHGKARRGGAPHAWLAGYCLQAGWIACDSTNGKLADLEFVPLSWGRDFGDVTALRGVVLDLGEQAMTVTAQFEQRRARAPRA